MTGFECYTLFMGIKLHFTSSYDFLKYNGKIHNVTINSFDSRKDKYFFHKLSRVYPEKEIFIDFLVSNFLMKGRLWVGDLLTDEAKYIYRNRQKNIESLSYIFENDCQKLFENEVNPNNTLKTCGEYPKLLIMTMRSEVTLETLCILNMILNFLPEWDKKITDTIQWPEYQKKIKKYSCFLPKNIEKFKIILKKAI
jgi:hypothetical protein